MVLQWLPSRSVRLSFLALLVLFLGAHTSPVYALYTNISASVVIGQSDFSGISVNQGGSAAANTLANPYGAVCAGNKLIVSDYSNNRVLIYNSIPSSANARADVVIGQPDFTSSAINQGGSCNANTLNGPDGIFSDGTKLIISDTANNRFLIYNSVPTSNNAPADLVVGQPDFTSCSLNQGGSAAANTIRGAIDVWYDGTKLYLVDGTNHRVLIYNSFPTTNNASADVVVGQSNFTDSSPNQGGSVAANTLSFPAGVFVHQGKLFTTETNTGGSGNGRMLIFNTIPIENNASADVVIGQPDFTSNSDNQGGSPNARTMFRARHSFEGNGRLFIPEDGSDRVRVFNSIPTSNNPAADIILGQVDEFGNTENQGGAPGPNTMNRPTGGSLCGDKLVIADRINSRVLIFDNRLPDVSLSHSIEGQPNGLLRFHGTSSTNVENAVVKYMEYSVNGGPWVGVQATDGQFESAAEKYYFDFDPKSNNPNGHEGFTVRVRSIHNEKDTGSSTLYFEPFVTHAPADMATATEQPPYFSFSLNTWRFSDIKENILFFRVSINKNNQGWKPYIDYIPVDYDSVRESADNLQKTFVSNPPNKLYENKHMKVIYTNDNATFTVQRKPVDGQGVVSDKTIEHGGGLLSQGIYAWRIEAVDRAGNIQTTPERLLRVYGNGSSGDTFFPLTIESFSGIGSNLNISTIHPEQVKQSYSTFYKNLNVKGIAFVGSEVAMALTDIACGQDINPSCTIVENTITAPDSRYQLSVPAKSGTYKVDLSVRKGNELFNALPTFTLFVK